MDFHGVLHSIRTIEHILEELFLAPGTQLENSAYYPQTNQQIEVVN